MYNVSVKRSEIIDAVRGNDCAKIVKILEDFGFSKTEPVMLIDSRHKLASVLLVQASAAAGGGRLDKSIAYDLIDYLSMSIDLFEFLGAMLTWRNYPRDSNYGKIPKELKKILSTDFKSAPGASAAAEKVANTLATLSKDAFMATCDYLNKGNAESLPVYFIPSFIRYIYAHRLLSGNWVLAYMALCLREPVDLPSLEPFGIAAIGGLDDFLSSIFGDD